MHTASRAVKKFSSEALLRYARLLGFGDIDYRIDPKTKLQAIIAVHNTTRGPAIGGCRFYPYLSYGHALKDVLQLASMMTVKNAACGLPHGGAKAVVIAPRGPFDRTQLFHAFGDFVNNLDGRYITAMDVGTTNQDMDEIAKRTPHVIGAQSLGALQEDPSPYTAKGVLRGIQAAVKFKLKRDSLENITVAIQGAGKVGMHLAQLLYPLGVHIIAADPNLEKQAYLQKTVNARIVSPDEITSVPCDVFAPCALGNVLTHPVVKKLRCSIVAGSANHQLNHRRVGQELLLRGILYAPDFVINAGGVIQAAYVHDYQDVDIANQKIDELYERLYNLFERAAQQNCPTAEVAYQMAHENLAVQ